MSQLACKSNLEANTRCSALQTRVIQKKITNFRTTPDANVASKSKTFADKVNESDRFYVLQKDSQRRKTLLEVLTQEEQKICTVWQQKIADGQPEGIVLDNVSSVEDWDFLNTI